ncbi:MAG: hypothetical protein QXS20_01360 [Candidatus Thorarchaeota archaeon]
MELRFSCPECRGPAFLRLSTEEAETLKARIKSEGRSPTVITKCEKGHELLVTVYLTEKGLAVRDVNVAVRTGAKKGQEIDWIRSAFGGN